MIKELLKRVIIVSLSCMRSLIMPCYFLLGQKTCAKTELAQTIWTDLQILIKIVEAHWQIKPSKQYRCYYTVISPDQCTFHLSVIDYIWQNLVIIAYICKMRNSWLLRLFSQLIDKDNSFMRNNAYAKRCI